MQTRLWRCSCMHTCMRTHVLMYIQHKNKLEWVIQCWFVLSTGLTQYKNRGSSFCIMTGYKLDGRGSNPGRGKKFLCSLKSSGYRGALSPGCKASAAWSWPLTSVQCRGQEWWSYASTPPHDFMAWCLIKKRAALPLFYTKWDKNLGKLPHLREVYRIVSCIPVLYFVSTMKFLLFEHHGYFAGLEVAGACTWLRTSL
jgi:hypothetical protein